ncbi:hypothetical protein [Paludisphaera mucosa]|uniref:Uncharacterized protein n=1 Tax=Paludisphaera mucosa TaxID=3030827 RepID=A0ABT6F6M0_9BACT|nr:hypothetical protein [Paludisphaera mucosa]MDG3003233.1 hypothetical protein [Paludisphaera mucosa]
MSLLEIVPDVWIDPAAVVAVTERHAGREVAIHLAGLCRPITVPGSVELVARLVLKHRVGRAA